VDANTEALKLSLAASDLWKGRDPGGSIPPIQLLAQEGGHFSIERGHPVRGQNPRVPFEVLTRLDAFPAYRTGSVTFESSQNGRFSQYVTTRVCWIQDDPEKPLGEYGGVVALWAFVVPSLLR
jgi:hypothetical protein